MDAGRSQEPSAFNLLFARNVPHILEKIFFSLDYGSFQTCFKVNRTWHKLLSSQFYQKKSSEMLIWKELNEKKLWLASCDGKIDDVKRLISSAGWMDVNCVVERQSTPLIEAANQGHTEVVSLLLHEKADPNKANSEGVTPLQLSAGKIDVVKTLLDGGAKPNKEDNNGWTPLHLAAHVYNSKDVVQLLLERGADPNKANRWGMTPLHYASEKEHTNVFKALLDGGAQPNKEDNDGWTPLHRAAVYGCKEVTQILLGRGADPNKAN